MPDLVLSNTTSFFSGNIEQVFKNAKKYGFKYVEIVPYRWITAQQILSLQKKYGVTVAGIHLPVWWDASLRQILREKPGALEKLFSCIFQVYLGDAKTSPGLKIAKALAYLDPYVLIHSNLALEMGPEFENITSQFRVVVENIASEFGPEKILWDPITIKKELGKRGIKGLVFDPGHFGQSARNIPGLDALATYQLVTPEVVHISYNSRFNHLLPDEKEQEELRAMLRLHKPKYLVIETNPLVSIKKAKKLLDQFTV
ncbi:MAG: hypothetical protein A3C85_00780 [Candidatus Doudnabacteria bacterium RIFCSPHIGHO2_02_FULL_48_21]|uniref:Xylose isomerase-like TIM barrel domain-containing protein n=1 Tax=Candidatus Doudnabacteria bacterium RIFCSPLOWO2_02_FULL_48_13 TaxID=1817845 RepID=A0A1F5QBD1_9BACT|nr:MAG: hypothetical protein A3K05_04770 [Candidatus Doudnabacteria bacterium RIFCSPHIGHO2_01_48_18]OGE77297.1 MAG: hypothetical protein A2668_02620 [Candidatus Doudnabacteria bacterium RIFCSPHIGHO2_01_FULL_48_180]OGE91022.1 MAG: hypothetical protein A3F44_01710 [Candidatus Doudnabacteria bacterium RIFCSPHIGHO2_12_FULL_47_25]OGE92837.1 MAG: hypothetical protein A3C85_00780 [Candidatus Doudnabacteria bacterium RIFCSPHIGHO2_02_FULL_48_21]OGE96868.1 MAG: hypothetical protein A3A83_04015 [Candidatu